MNILTFVWELLAARRFKKAIQRAEAMHLLHNRQYLVLNISGRPTIATRQSIRQMIKDQKLSVDYDFFLKKSYYITKGICS